MTVQLPSCHTMCVQVRSTQKEKEETLNQIQSWGVNAFVSQQLQDLRDALQACHAERDDALEQLRTANHVKREMASRLLELGAGTFEPPSVPAQSSVPPSPIAAAPPPAGDESLL